MLSVSLLTSTRYIPLLDTVVHKHSAVPLYTFIYTPPVTFLSSKGLSKPSFTVHNGDKAIILKNKGLNLQLTK